MNRINQDKIVRVHAGQFYADKDAHLRLVSVLGSCVSACIRNPHSGFGGINHFMLPWSQDGEWGGVMDAFRFGNHAMNGLINEVLKSGCLRHELEIKLFGGADMYLSQNQIGSQNAAFVLNYLDQEGLSVSAYDLGGNRGRRIHYWPSTGRVKRLSLNDNCTRKVYLGDTILLN